MKHNGVERVLTKRTEEDTGTVVACRGHGEQSDLRLQHLCGRDVCKEDEQQTCQSQERCKELVNGFREIGDHGAKELVGMGSENGVRKRRDAIDTARDETARPEHVNRRRERTIRCSAVNQKSLTVKEGA